MSTEHQHDHGTAAAPTGLSFVGCDLKDGHAPVTQTGRRAAMVAGKRVRVVDIHAHCAVPEALNVPGLKVDDPPILSTLHMGTSVDRRLETMDAQGIDMQALSINPFWYTAEREVAEQVIRIQNEKLAEACAAHPDRFVAFASVALQYPDMAARQLEDGVKKYGLRGAAIGASVNDMELSDPRLHPFWAKVEELGVLVFIHPQATGVTTQLASRLKGNGYLSNIIGFPVETSIALSHLIFEGTLDRFPALKICSAHGGGFLPSYAGRSDRGCLTLPAACEGGTYGGIQKKPTDYLKQLYFDTMVFSTEAIRHLAAEVGASQLMVGTDYPYPWTKTMVEEVLATPGLSDADRVAILGGTAEMLLKIK
jgi:predicted TIM-barrel fold metal-dependent hydrolase